jgi:hypothetical protein
VGTNRRSNADRWRSIADLLADPGHRAKSDSYLARMAGFALVSPFALAT